MRSVRSEACTREMVRQRSSQGGDIFFACISDQASTDYLARWRIFDSLKSATRKASETQAGDTLKRVGQHDTAQSKHSDRQPTSFLKLDLILRSKLDCVVRGDGPTDTARRHSSSQTHAAYLEAIRRYRGTFGWFTRFATSMRSMAIPSLAACGALSANNALSAARAVFFRRSVAASAAASAAALSAAGRSSRREGVSEKARVVGALWIQKTCGNSCSCLSYAS